MTAKYVHNNNGTAIASVNLVVALPPAHWRASALNRDPLLYEQFHQQIKAIRLSDIGFNEENQTQIRELNGDEYHRLKNGISRIRVNKAEREYCYLGIKPKPKDKNDGERRGWM
jgi:hypothetical protein